MIQESATPGLYECPVLVIDPGMHAAIITGAAVDSAARWAVTGSHDKTVRLWSLADGAMLRTIRLPSGPGNLGKVYTVAISSDGTLIAAGGWTRDPGPYSPDEQIYFFDRASGALVRRIEGLPNVVNHVAFSPENKRLAAVLGGRKGLSIYACERNPAEIARDADYGDQSYGACFAPDGRLATTSLDGKVRLYTGNLDDIIRPAVVIPAPRGRQPYGIAFSPDGSRLAIGYHDSTAITILDGRTLIETPGPDLKGIEGGDLSRVAWSRDGKTLFAAGRYSQNDGSPVLAWDDAGAGARRILRAGKNTVMSLVPLRKGELLIAAQDPWLARLKADGKPGWLHGPPKADFRAQFDTFAVSSDGSRIDFGFGLGGEQRARFDLATRKIMLNPLLDPKITRARLHGLPITSWLNEFRPTLQGRPLALQQRERSRSLAVHPTGDRFVLGTEWSLRAFDHHGAVLWSRAAQGVVPAVNITADGRLVVATYGDGTIRWHRMSDGVELLAFMPMPDQTNWVAWTPEGFYGATGGAHGILRWHVNRGWDAPADTIPVEEILGLRRPEVLPLVLQELETPRALGLADLAYVRQQVAIRTHSRVPPGTQLHLLTVGISQYHELYAKRLRLDYADRDARDLASAVASTQGRLYSAVKSQTLLNRDANKAGILRALKTMRAGLQASTGNDLAVVHFSGHGALVDRTLYLLPYEVDARDMVGIQTYGLSMDELRGQLEQIAKDGRVLVLLDACHSGTMTMNGVALSMDSTVLRTGLAGANVTVLTSSSGNELSREDPKWGHGAFTKVLLDALTDPAADPDRNGLIKPTALAHYVDTRVKTMTDGAQKSRNGGPLRHHGVRYWSLR